MLMTGKMPDAEAMQMMLEMGAAEGYASAAGQIDAILAEDTAPATA